MSARSNFTSPGLLQTRSHLVIVLISVLTGIPFLLFITQVELYLLRVPLTACQLYTLQIQTCLPAPVTQLTCTRVLTFVLSYCYSHVHRAWFSGL